MLVNDKYLISNTLAESHVLQEALIAAQLSGTGKMVEDYEQALQDYFDSPYALAQSSGSAALHTALYCLGVRAGDEVLIPAIAPIPTVLPLLTLGAKPVVVDIEVHGLGFDVEDLKRKVTHKTKAAILVPLWGYPINYAKNLAVLNSHDIPLIEDTAQAHGSHVNQQFMGTFGTVGCFSTHDRKLLSTGEGGFILTEDEALQNKMRQFSQLGYMDGKHYGVNHKISALQASLGRFRLKHIQQQIETRTLHVRTIREALKDTKITAFPVVSNGTANYYSLVLKLPWHPQQNIEFIKQLDTKGIPSDITKYGFCPIYERPQFKAYKTACPNAEYLIRHMTTLPVHPAITEQEIQHMVETLVNLYEQEQSFAWG